MTLLGWLGHKTSTQTIRRIYFPHKIGFDISCNLSPKEEDSLYEMANMYI